MSVCTSIGIESVHGCVSCSKMEEMVELRADLCRFSPREAVSVIKSLRCPVILTARGREDDKFLLNVLGSLEYGDLEYVDLELDASRGYSELVRKAAGSLGARFIVSFHDFKDTPCPDELLEIYGLCVSRGADIVKIVTHAACIEDASRVLQLYHAGTLEKPLVAFAMGEKGSFTRRLCLALGAPFTYCAANVGQATAPGQLTARQMRRLLSPESYPVNLNCHPSSSSEAILPCSKSFAQRAMIAAAMAPGTSRLHGYTGCDDTESALDVVRTLGADVKVDGDDVIICGVKPEQVDVTSLNVGESGLLARLMVPISSLFSGKHGAVVVEGRGTLLKRDLSDVDDLVTAAGGRVGSNGGRMPFTAGGALKGGFIEVDGSRSSQSVSGLLMTLPLLPVDSVLHVKSAVSTPYIEMTLRVLKMFGVEIGLSRQEGTLTFRIPGRQHYVPVDVALEPDWSSAANLVVAAHIAHYLRPEWKIFLPDLKKVGGQADEQVLDLVGKCGPLRSFVFDASHCPDLFPIAAVLACFCHGTSVLRGVGRLYRKESDRAEAIFSELTVLGAMMVIEGDEMHISGRGLHGGMVLSHSDHRMVMALSVAALFIAEPVRIDGVESISKSFPTFFSFLEKLFAYGMIMERK